MKVRVSGLVWLPKAEMTIQQVLNLKSQLTIYPTKTTDIGSKSDPPPIFLFEDTEDEIGIPRGFYQKAITQKHDEVLQLAKGRPMAPLETMWRSEGKFVEQGDVLKTFQHLMVGKSWGGFLLRAGCAFGKALAHGEPVLTPNGYVPIEKIFVGNVVAGTDGSFHRVVGVYPQGKRKCFRVSFTDGTHVDCDGDHLWTFEKRRSRGKQVTIDTNGLHNSSLRDKYGRVFWLPEVKPVEFYGVEDLPIDPYTLGALLGDGSIINGVRFWSEDIEIVNNLVIPPDCSIVCSDGNSGNAQGYRIISNMNGGERNSMWQSLKSLGIGGSDSHWKSIPFQYRHATVESRISLLQGLFDTDGRAMSSGMVDYSTVSKDLAHNVKFVVESLGGTCVMSRRGTYYTKNNGKKVGPFPSYRLTVKLPRNIDPFRLQRKMKIINSDSWQRRIGRAVDNVSALGEKFATCISVDSPDRLFLTRGCIPTHNTATALEFARRVGLRTLILVHQEFFLEQWKERIEYFMPEARVGIIRQKRMEFEDVDFAIGMLQSLAKDVDGTKYPKKMYDAFGMVISDECFVGNTIVKTVNGDKRINEIERGDVVLNAVGFGKVVRTSSKLVPIGDMRLVTMFDGVEFLCTKDHPWLTINGWMPSSDIDGHLTLTNADSIGIMLRYGKQKNIDLSYLQRAQFSGSWGKILFSEIRRIVETERISDVRAVYSGEGAAVQESVMFEGLYREMDKRESRRVFHESFGSCQGVAHGESSYPGGGIESDEGEESDAFSLCKRKGVEIFEGDESQTASARWERIGVDSPSVDVIGCAGEQIGSRVGSSNRCVKGPGDGQKENSILRGIRVESVVIPEQNDFERHEISVVGDSVKVFNLTVSGHPSYVLGNNIVVHNCHRVGATSFANIIPRFNAPWRVGLSVGPMSIVELRGGIFGTGWVGTIEESFSIMNKRFPIVNVSGYEVLNVTGVESRGWNKSRFIWKSIKSVLRHKCDRKASVLRVRGSDILATNDHSIYKVYNGEKLNINHNIKYSALISECKAGNIKKNDTVVMDDGMGWDDSSVPRTIDVPSLIHNDGNNVGNVHVRVDLSSISRKDIMASPRSWYRFNNRKGGSGLPLDVFIKYRDILPCPTCVYTEGANGASVDAELQLSDIAWVLGFWLGDGWINGGRICFAVEDSMVDTVRSKLESISVLNWNVTMKKTPAKSHEIRCSNSIFSRVLKAELGDVDAKTKKIPGEWIASWSKNDRMSLINGLVASDGHISSRSRNRKRVFYTTTSYLLAKTLLSCLRSVGIAGSLNTTKATDGGTINGRKIVERSTRYVVHWSLYSGSGNNLGHHGLRRKYEHGELSFTEGTVRSVDDVNDLPEYVYDFEMDGHPSFVVDGVLVHNSATPSRKDGAQDVFFHHISQITYNAKSEAAVPKLRVLKTHTVLKPISRGRYFVATANLNSAQVLTQLGEDEFRARDIVDQLILAVKAGRKIMVVSERINHLKKMSDMLTNSLFNMNLPFPVKVDFYTGEWFTGGKWENKTSGHKKGDLKTAKRSKEDLKKAESANVIFATKQMVAEGLDIQAIDVLVLSMPWSDVEQIVGRARRWCVAEPNKCKRLCPWRAGKCEEKPTPIIMDVIDQDIPQLVSKWNRRQAFYRKIGTLEKKGNEDGGNSKRQKCIPT